MALALFVALLIAGAVWLYSLMSQPAEGTKKRAVQQIELIKPPPPPPPPKTPPPPPPPQQKQEKIDAPKPEASPQPAAQAPAPGPTTSLPGNGSGGITLPPGDGSTGIGPVGGGGSSNPFARYGSLVKELITDAVQRDKKLRAAADYQRVVNVWVSSSGQVTRVELVGPGDKPELDEALRLALRNLPAVREGAPGDMPQPIRLRITTRS
jgi:periplasmic protein TonB